MTGTTKEISALIEKRELLPKVLLVCDGTIEPFSGGGATLGSLFSLFPPANLFSVHGEMHAPAKSRIAHTITLDSGAIRYVLGVGYILRALRSWRQHQTEPVVLAKNSTDTVVNENKCKIEMRNLLAHFSRYEITSGDIERIVKFEPDLIYGWAGSPAWMRLVKELADRLRLPYVVHFMDNHIGVRADYRVGKIANQLFRRQVDQLVSEASSVLTISRSMSVAYGARWKINAQVFHAVMSTTKWPIRIPHSKNGEIELVFTGSVGDAQLTGLVDIAKAVKILNSEGWKFRLVLYITDYYRSKIGACFDRFTCVTLRSHPETDQLRTVLCQADALVLAYGFKQEHIDYYQYSFPTKLVPYMLSQSPIIAYGPETIAPISYVLQGGWGIVVTNRSIEMLANSIRRIVTEPSRCARFGELAREAARREHDQTETASRFAKCLFDVARAQE